MKKKIFSTMAIAAIVFTACKKEEPATVELEEAVITGNVWADLDQTNDIQNGVYIEGLNPEGVSGMQVSVEIDTRDLDHSPDNTYDYEVRTFTAVTNAAGDYTITLPAPDKAFNLSVNIKFQDIYTTKTILAEDGSTLSEAVEVTLGDKSALIYAGATVALKNEASVSTVNTNAENYGTATLRGNIYADWNQGVFADCNTPYPCQELCDVSSPFSGLTLMWAYYDGPHGEGENIWSPVTLASDGSYEIVVTTEGVGESAVGINFGFADFISTRNGTNVAQTADSTYNCIWKIGGFEGESYGPLESGDIKIYDVDYSIFYQDL